MLNFRNQIKQEIVNALSVFQTRITIRHSQGAKIFEEVLRENPKLLFYVSKYSYITRPLSLTPTVVADLTYSNTDVPLKNVHSVRTREELEYVLHKGIESSLSTVGICAPIDMPVSNIYSDFSVTYNGYYSNLVHTEYYTSRFESYGTVFVRFNFRYRIGRVQLNMMERRVDEEVARLSQKLFCPRMTKEEKAYIAHNYLAKTVEYWHKDDADPLDRSYMQSAYGALINHKCVCQGYAEAYKRILDYEGIECQVICGKVKQSQVHHAWNVISFDKKVYYHVDVTWDSLGDGTVGWRYFGLSDAEMKETRLWSKRAGIVCNSTQNIRDIAKRRILENKMNYMLSGIDRRYM